MEIDFSIALGRPWRPYKFDTYFLNTNQMMYSQEKNKNLSDVNASCRHEKAYYHYSENRFMKIALDGFIHLTLNIPIPKEEKKLT